MVLVYATCTTDKHAAAASSLVMVDANVPTLIAAERLHEGLVLKFSDGQCGFYSTTLLYAKLAESEALNEEEIAW